MSSISPCLTGRSRSTTSYESRVGVSSSTSRANFAISPPDAARSMSLLAELSPRARDPKSMTLHTPFRLARVRMLSMTFCLRSIVSALSLWGRRSAPRTILSIGHTFPRSSLSPSCSRALSCDHLRRSQFVPALQTRRAPAACCGRGSASSGCNRGRAATRRPRPKAPWSCPRRPSCRRPWPG